MKSPSESPKAKERRKRQRVRGHPLLRDRPKGQWYPDLVGKVPGYPTTLEKWQARRDLMAQQVRLYNAEGIARRSGVPDGWAGRKDEMSEIITKARQEGRELAKYMAENDLIKTDDPRAEEALAEMIAVVRAKDENGKHLFGTSNVISAARTVLEYTKAKPAQEVKATVTKAEDWLAQIAAGARKG